jgi:hypothetical protein
VAAKALVQPLSIRLPLNQVKRPELYCGLFCWPDCRRHRCCGPGFVESGDWISCHGRVLEPYRGQHAEAAVAALPIVEDLQVLKDRVGQFDPGALAVSVKQLHLHPRPERLDHGVEAPQIILPDWNHSVSLFSDL